MSSNRQSGTPLNRIGAFGHRPVPGTHPQPASAGDGSRTPRQGRIGSDGLRRRRRATFQPEPVSSPGKRHCEGELYVRSPAPDHNRPWMVGRVRDLVAIGTAATLVAGAALASVSAVQAAPNEGVIVASADRVEERVAVTLGQSGEAPVQLTGRSATTTLSAEKSERRVAKIRAEMRELTLRKAVVKLARQQLGDRYVRGAAGPNAFDCSGLVRYVFGKVMGKKLPHSSRAQYQVVKKIKRSQAKPGDLVFFFEKGARHVGIYIGGGRMIDARNPGDDVSLSPIGSSWWSRSYSGMGRIIADA